MIEVCKKEAMALKRKYGNEVGITITCKKKKSNRKTYYVEEASRVIYFLDRLRKRQEKRGARVG